MGVGGIRAASPQPRSGACVCGRVPQPLCVISRGSTDVRCFQDLIFTPNSDSIENNRSATRRETQLATPALPTTPQLNSMPLFSSPRAPSRALPTFWNAYLCTRSSAHGRISAAPQPNCLFPPEASASHTAYNSLLLLFPQSPKLFSFAPARSW